MTEGASSESGPARVTAVVLTWNTADLAIQTLQSLEGGYADGLRVVLVDNGSVDDSVEVIQAFLDGWDYSPSVTLVRSPENVGFPGGVNLGTEAALAANPPPDYIWTLNPDAVVNPETATEMVAVSIESGAEIVGVGTAGAPHVAANAWPRIYFLPHSWCATVSAPNARWFPAGRYGGSCALFRAGLVRRLIARDGHFEDASLFLDWDEWEVTRRAATLGASVVLAGRAHQEHDAAFRTFGPSPMAKARQYYQSRNAISVCRRFMPSWQFWLMLPIHFARDFSWFARLRIHGEHPNERAYLLGAFDGLRGNSGRWSRHPRTPTQAAAGLAGPLPDWPRPHRPLTGDPSTATAVVVCWNTPKLAIRTLESLAAGFATGLRIVLVDNGSVDGSAMTIQSFLDGWPHSANVTFVQTPENLGFTGGVNLGAEVALDAVLPPDFIWMLNPDAEVSPATVVEMLEVARESGAPIVSGVADNGKYVREDAWPEVFWARPKTIDRRVPREDRWWRVGRYDGASSIFDARLVRELIRRDGHFLDPALFVDWDEWDATRRAESLGASVVHARGAVHVHSTNSRTLGKSPITAARQYYQSRNALIVSRRYMPWWQFWLTLPVHLGRDLSWFVRLRVKGIHPNERAYLVGAFDGIRGKTGKWKHHPKTPTQAATERSAPSPDWREGERVDSGDPPSVTAVVVCWNTPDLAIKTLESLEGGYANGLTVVLVDNGSVDDSVQVIQAFLDDWQHSPSVTFVRNPENNGFTGGVNLGTEVALRAARAPQYIWLLNPDAVVSPDTLQEMVSVAEESGAGIVSVGGRERELGNVWPRRFWWPPVRARKAPAEARWWLGDCYRGWCAIFEAGLVRKLIERHGQFQDESLFMYWDERDTTLRARSLGAVVALVRDAHAEHSGGNQRGRSNIAAARQYYLARNAIVVAKRYLPWWQFWWMLPLRVARDLVWLTRLRLTEEHPNFEAYFLGVWDGLRGKMGKWKHHPPAPDANA